MKALVVGGTGPSGPHIVNGLIRRGYEVSVLHGGQHEAEFIQPVEHIHTDPHFQETLQPSLEGRSYDVAIATYGRIRIVAEVLKGKASRFIAVGGSGVYARRDDPRWGPMGPPMYVPEDSPRTEEPTTSRFSYLMWQTEETIMEAHRRGYYNASIFRYPMLFGPNAPANPEWSVVRRVLDGRKRFIMPTNGIMRRRGYAENAAHALLLGVDKPEITAGQTYNVRDDKQYTQRQQVEFIAGYLHHEWEIVELPPSLARKVSKGAAGAAGISNEFDITKIKAQLGYRDVVPAWDALARSVDWLLANRPEPGGENEVQLGDPFAYEDEDELLAAYRLGVAEPEKMEFPEIHSGHMYRHPKKPGEAWSPPPA